MKKSELPKCPKCGFPFKAEAVRYIGHSEYVGEEGWCNCTQLKFFCFDGKYEQTRQRLYRTWCAVVEAMKGEMK